MIGDQLKKYREQAHLSQNEVADALMLTRQAISKWENNRTYPDIDNLIRLSNLYSVTLDNLLAENKDLKKKLNINTQKITETTRECQEVCVNENPFSWQNKVLIEK